MERSLRTACDVLIIGAGGAGLATAAALASRAPKSQPRNTSRLCRATESAIRSSSVSWWPIGKGTSVPSS